MRHRPLVLGALVALSLAAACTSAPRAASSSTTAPPPPPPPVEGHPAPGATDLLDTSCAGADHCWAVGTGTSSSAAGNTQAVVTATVDGGRSWTAQPVSLPAPSALTSVSCPTTRHCMAVGNSTTAGQLAAAVLVTDDGGTSWRLVAAPPGAVDLLGLVCKADGHCMALATNGSSFWTASTVDDGQVWQRGGGLPPNFAGPRDLTCASSLDCVVAGYLPAAPGKGAGAVAYSTTGGASWASGTVPPGIGLLHDATCSATGTCLAVGTASPTDSDVSQAAGVILQSVNGGSTWAAVPTPSGVDDAFGVSCGDPRSCAVVGTEWAPTTPPTPLGGVVASIDGGTTWATLRTRYVPSGLTAVDCPDVSRCVAVGGDVVATVALPPPAKGAPSR